MSDEEQKPRGMMVLDQGHMAHGRTSMEIHLSVREESGRLWKDCLSGVTYESEDCSCVPDSTPAALPLPLLEPRSFLSWTLPWFEIQSCTLWAFAQQFASSAPYFYSPLTFCSSPLE